jgi:hypothetical protein
VLPELVDGKNTRLARVWFALRFSTRSSHFNQLTNQRDIRSEIGIHGEKRSHAGVGPELDSWYGGVAENTGLFL